MLAPPVAKTPKKIDGDGDGKKKPGRPATGIETDSFCCRAAVSLIEAFTQLAKVRRTKKPGTELHNAAEAHVRRMYALIKADPDSELIDREAVPAFLEAAEAYFKEAGLPPPKSD